MPGSGEALGGLLLEVHGIAEDGDVGAHEGVEDFGVGAYSGFIGGAGVAVGVVPETGVVEGVGWRSGWGEEGGGFGGGVGGAESAEGG